MSKQIETGGFQALTEQESVEISGGAGIASTWIELGRDITLRAITAVRDFFGSNSAPKLFEGMDAVRTFLSNLFENLIGSFRQSGL